MVFCQAYRHGMSPGLIFEDENTRTRATKGFGIKVYGCKGCIRLSVTASIVTLFPFHVLVGPIVAFKRIPCRVFLGNMNCLTWLPHNLTKAT